MDGSCKDYEAEEASLRLFFVAGAFVSVSFALFGFLMLSGFGPLAFFFLGTNCALSIFASPSPTASLSSPAFLFPIDWSPGRFSFLRSSYTKYELIQLVVAFAFVDMLTSSHLCLVSSLMGSITSTLRSFACTTGTPTTSFRIFERKPALPTANTYLCLFLSPAGCYKVSSHFTSHWF